MTCSGFLLDTKGRLSALRIFNLSVYISICVCAVEKLATNVTLAEKNDCFDLSQEKTKYRPHLNNFHLMWTRLNCHISTTAFSQLSCDSRKGIFPVPDGEGLHLSVLIGQITAGDVAVKRGLPT